MRSSILPTVLCAAVLAACGGAAPGPASSPGAPATAAPAPAVNAANAALDVFFADYDAAELRRSPMAQSERGIKTDYGTWDDFTDAQAARNHDAEVAALTALRSRFAGATLDDAHRLSFRLFHDVVLRNGPLPLDILDAEVSRWVSSQLHASR